MASRVKNWEFILYPENTDKEILLEKLSELQINYYLSPLHNMDVYTKLDVQNKKCEENQIGIVKKEHWHLILCFSSMKSFPQAVEIAKEIGASLYVKEIHSLKGALRYLCHLDEKRKFHYKVEDVECRFNDYLDRIEEDKARIDFVGELIACIKINQINEFFELVCFLQRNNQTKLLQYVQKNAYFCVSLVKSVRFKIKAEKEEREERQDKKDYLAAIAEDCDTPDWVWDELDNVLGDSEIKDEDRNFDEL